MITKRIVFFYGYCTLCNHFLEFLVRFDRSRKLHFASLQGKTAEELLEPKDRTNLDSMVLWEDGIYAYRSLAVLRAVSAMGGLWKIVMLFRIIPPFMRDWLYNLVARNRFRWFGKRSTCRIPTKKEAAYILP